ncbi:type-1 fimbrial protein subunit A [Acinetobacter sp. Ac_877]|uniref:type 1 fimbrial major subunit FimA n=1 Tax=Acinetobacter portensis TaxID=1839785 RepID=UPI00128C3627|nr:type 1 fimbrial major subunit FimA [Acinetobacter portensis]MPW41288.1 type-1 fimbrial protein subunit A [Acinetobacter portensis]
MKINALNLTLLSTVLCSATAFAADPITVNGGTVHFTGELVNAACAVSTASANQTVELGQYRTASLAEAGKKTTPVPFKIQLVDCDPTVQATAAVAFYGQTSDVNPELLSVSAGGTNATAAQNVGIEVADDKSKILGFSGKDFSNPKTLLEGNNDLNFTARYVSTGTATPGTANADATFVVKYE